MHLLTLLKTRYTQLGGLRLVRQYAKMGLLWPAAKTVLRHPFRKQTYKQVYLDTVRKVEPILVKEYRPVMKEIAERVRNEASVLAHKRSKTIWFCWLQGLENAPEVVRADTTVWFTVNGSGLMVMKSRSSMRTTGGSISTCRTISSAAGRRNRSLRHIFPTC